LVGFLERPRKLLPVLAGAIPNAPDRLGRYPNILASKKDRAGLATCKSTCLRSGDCGSVEPCNAVR
jgi:hypothetical protein